MDVDFADQKLALVDTDRAAETLLPVSVIRTVRQRLCLMRAAPNFATLSAWRSFGLCPTVKTDGVRIIEINENWRMAAEFDDASTRARATIVRIGRDDLKGTDND